MTEPKDLKKEAPKKKGFKMPDIYIVLGTFILFMALLTYIVPAGQYDRQVVETATAYRTSSWPAPTSPCRSIRQAGSTL